MSPLGPNEIPDDTTGRGLVGWVGESLARGLVLRLALFVALVGALLGGINEVAPSWARVASAVVGVGGAGSILVSQLAGWRRARQWALLLLVLVVAIFLFAYHLSLR